MPPPTRQLRKVVLPLTKLIEYLDRRTNELTNAKLHHANYDQDSGRMFLYIESEHGKPVPADVPMNWDEIFGTIPCEVSGERTFVDDITVSRAAADKLQARIAELEEKLEAAEDRLRHATGAD